MGHPVARKRFGQHFLHDRTIIAKILDALEPDSNETIVEIGPGRGALTFPLLERIDTLHVIEIDRDLAALLQEHTQSHAGLHVHCIDVLTLSLDRIISSPVKVVGNLPYNISTPLLFHLLQQTCLIRSMTFMLQEEVVDRMVAEPGSKTYGRLSVMVQSRCSLNKLFRVPPAAFSPPPKVHSAVVQLVPDNQLADKIDNNEMFEIIVRESFNHRRKTIKNSLKNLFTVEGLEAAGINPEVRPEQLQVNEFIQLANYHAARKTPD